LPSSKPRQRLQDIIDAIDTIRRFVTDAGNVEAAMYKSQLHRLAIERALLIIAEAATKLGSQAPELAPETPWDEVRGVGNYIRHNYDALNDQMLFETVRDDLEPLRAACERALQALGPGD
jgi:uncharacterized protein with HEPN domain